MLLLKLAAAGAVGWLGWEMWQRRLPELPDGLQKPPVKNEIKRGANVYQTFTFRTGTPGRTFQFARHKGSPDMWIGFYAVQGGKKTIWRASEPDDVPEGQLVTQLRKDFGV